MFFFPVLLYHQHCKVNQKEEFLEVLVLFPIVYFVYITSL